MFPRSLGWSITLSQRAVRVAEGLRVGGVGCNLSEEREPIFGNLFLVVEQVAELHAAVYPLIMNTV